MSFEVTRIDFSSDKEFEEYQQRMKEMAADELKHNIRMLQDIRNQEIETPCQTFYKMKKSIPLSVFIQVYPFNELVDCGSGFDLPELMELETLYNTLEQKDKQFYIDSFNRLQQIISHDNYMENRIPSTPPAPPAPPAPPVPTLFGRVKSLFGLGGGRKTTKKTLMRHKRSKSRSKKLRSKKLRSKSRSKK